MRYQKYPPSPFLKAYVVSYYLWESGGPLKKPFSIASCASNCFAMVFNYKVPYRLHNPIHKGTLLPQQFLSGQSTSAYTLELTEQIGMAGIIFRGGALRSLFKLPNPAEFLDDRIDLGLLLGHQADEITKQLAEASSDLRRIQVLENFLLEKLRKNASELTLADKAASIILDNKGMIRMDDLAQKLHISPRQLRRTFKARLGVNPKYFARVKRFNYVNLCLTKNPDASWRYFISEEGFYDQAHFIKDYQEFFGKTPTIQIKENRQMETKLIR